MVVTDWSSLKVGTKYVFHIRVDFADFQVMRNRAHNAARRRGFKAITRRDVARGIFEVTFVKNESSTAEAG